MHFFHRHTIEQIAYSNRTDWILSDIKSTHSHFLFFNHYLWYTLVLYTQVHIPWCKLQLNDHMLSYLNNFHNHCYSSLHSIRQNTLKKMFIMEVCVKRYINYEFFPLYFHELYFLSLFKDMVSNLAPMITCFLQPNLD